MRYFEMDQSHVLCLDIWYKDCIVSKYHLICQFNIPKWIKIFRVDQNRSRHYLRSHVRNQGGETLGMFFLIGQVDTKDRRSKILEAEIKKFDDFIIGDYVDSYKNLTEKTFSGYKYVTENCHHDFKWALFLDDDTIIDENEFNRLIITTENENQGKPDEELRHPYCLAGLKWSKSGVVRPDNCFISEYKERFFYNSHDEF